VLILCLMDQYSVYWFISSFLIIERISSVGYLLFIFIKLNFVLFNWYIQVSSLNYSRLSLR
jgi:hypothetical protein